MTTNTVAITESLVLKLQVESMNPAIGIANPGIAASEMITFYVPDDETLGRTVRAATLNGFSVRGTIAPNIYEIVV